MSLPVINIDQLKTNLSKNKKSQYYIKIIFIFQKRLKKIQQKTFRPKNWLNRKWWYWNHQLFKGKSGKWITEKFNKYTQVWCEKENF